MEVGQADALLGELVGVWTAHVLAAVAAEVGVAHVVDQYEDDVGPARLARLGGERGDSGRKKDDSERASATHEMLRVNECG